jgi:hypothetical protein
VRNANKQTFVHADCQETPSTQGGLSQRHKHWHRDNFPAEIAYRAAAFFQ